MNKDAEIQKIKKCITDLVYDKVSVRKAYNYYHCKRDPEQFKHLEENFGIGTPTSITFTPLIKKHIDVLVGEYLELDPDLQITCKDEQTLSNIMRDKQLKITESVFEKFKDKLVNTFINSLMADSKETVQDPFFVQEIEKLKKSISDSFVSEYEKAAQNLLIYFKQSRTMDVKNKMRELFTDLLISGLAYYRLYVVNNSVKFEVLNPLDTFIERNPNEYYLNKSRRAVIRKWMTLEQVLLEYKDELSKEAIAELKSINKKDLVSHDAYVEVPSSLISSYSWTDEQHILGGRERSSTRTYDNNYYTLNEDVISVYICEWLEYEDNKITRHEGIQIGNSVYIVRGAIDDVPRSVSDPKACTLSVNGLFFNDKNGDPFSLIISTMDIQDKYDLTIYYRDSLIASSGTVGDWVDVNHLPTFLGNELTERLQKWTAYKKQGMGLFDSSQEGAQLLNTTFNGYDDTLKAGAIQAFELVKQSLEQQASSITGVFAEKLGDIQQRDAVSNVKVGIRQSTLLTKQYFVAMDSLYKEINYDYLNCAKVAYKDGISGVLINGHKLNQVFTALPEYYTMTDFDVHIQDSAEAFNQKNDLKASSIELIKAGHADPSMLINIVTARNVTELKDYINDAVKTQKEENNVIGNLQQQLQQMQEQLQASQKQLKELESENKSLKNRLETNNEEKLRIENRRVDVEEREMEAKKEYNDKMAKNKERQVDIEFMQVYDANPYNDKIKNI